ncbi:hypothetical protein PLICRDRAFT_507626 [Plicaturopsis crispa FD-325 SS-3]|nr:hypothetical protein PLICRDRAFT_507626 [Plicaturopsis crispa FD-325 SS-3]
MQALLKTSIFTFCSVLDDETDMTIPVIVRSWVVSTDDRDAFVVSKAMFDLWTPDVPPLLPYRTANPAPASIFFRVIQGAGRDDIVVNTFASHLGTLRGVDANHELHFLLVLLTGSQRFEEPGERFLRLLVESKPLWTKLFSLIATSNTDDMSTEDICVVQYGLDVMTDTLKLCSSDTADLMTAELGRAWINAGVFDALDAITSHSLTHNLPRFSAQLLLIFVGLRCALDAAPELESILSGQLPRPRMLSTLQKLTETHLRVTDLFAPSFLLASDMKKLPRSLADLDAVSVGRAIRDCSQYMQALETRCVVAGQCGRRGCEARASSRCAKCRKIAYCGPKCQKKDWKAHKSVCSDQAR